MPEEIKVIEAQEIVLRDETGAARILMSALGAGGPIVQVRGESNSSIELRALPEKGGVALILRASQRHVVVRLI